MSKIRSWSFRKGFSRVDMLPKGTRFDRVLRGQAISSLGGGTRKIGKRRRKFAGSA